MSEKERFMREAIIEAQKAYQKKEVPIGAVVVKDGQIIGRGHNLRETEKNSLYHAEIMAIDEACKKLNAWRLSDCDLYVTIEPCPMCAGAIIQSRIKNVYFGSLDYKGGAVISVTNMLDIETFNHKVNYESGILETQCQGLMKDFFKELRKSKSK